MLITGSAELVDLCDRIRATGLCAFDTEFVSEKSYWPKLGLVQIAGPGGHVGAVDPLALQDLSPLWDLLLSPEMTVVVHAGTMDWRILARQTGRVPARTFDSQIAASFLGFGFQVGYGALVEALLGRRIDKSERLTDWLKRPLSPQQIEYAIGDVTHLLDVHRALEVALSARGRLEWAKAEFVDAGSIRRFEDPDPYTLHLGFRRGGGLGRRELAVLRELLAWRELEARARDARPNYLLKDDVLAAAARRMPRTEAELATIRGVPTQELRRLGPPLLGAIRRALALPETELPEVQLPEPQDAELGLAGALLNTVVVARAREAEVAPEIVMPGPALRALIKEGPDATWPDGRAVLAGWRREVLGQQFIDVLCGQAAVGLDRVTRRVRVVAIG